MLTADATTPIKRRSTPLLVLLLSGVLAAKSSAADATLPAPPVPAGIPMPGPKTEAPYAPQTILPGGVVIPLYPPGSPYLRAQDIREPEVYRMWAPGQIGAITHIHNPSIEFHPGNGQLATGAAIILAGGGGHASLNAGEASPFVPFFANHGVSTVILRNRLRSDGYEPKTDKWTQYPIASPARRVALDSKGNVLVCEYFGHKIAMPDPSSGRVTQDNRPLKWGDH